MDADCVERSFNARANSMEYIRPRAGRLIHNTTIMGATHNQGSSPQRHADNILVGEGGAVKLADFGLTVRLTEEVSRRRSLVGTPHFMAPEIIEKSGYDCKADIWSLGITANEMAQGETLNSQVATKDVLAYTATHPPPSLDSKRWDPNFVVFVKVCLKKDPAKRPTAKRLMMESFITKAAKTSVLLEVIARAKECRKAEAVAKPSEAS
ncbi:hypothetical protein OESDEN_08952 [Oesophagostomum dentatum]|uniref:Protein kinase domain-containing protein n=1 Tax=Oesophagostomum dentatum TaxID=61180 RepID=A0A0B1T1U2_OESDE|nr:hypothetical protein OESDEN_08952 [Oesophagostomum dentatum]